MVEELFYGKVISISDSLVTDTEVNICESEVRTNY